MANNVNGRNGEELFHRTENTTSKVRNLIGFWLLGLCNNYAYVVMLSAAVDILAKFKDTTSEDATANVTGTGNYTCTPESAGTILLADILPALFIKLCGPFINWNTHFQVVLVVLLSVGSFLLTSMSPAKWVAFLGVVAASLGSGLGEITFLKYSARFDKNVVSSWSSGTGGAGVLGALSYAAIVSFISPEHTLQVMLIIPVLLAISFWIILDHPRMIVSESQEFIAERAARCCGQASAPGPTISLKQKLRLVKPLLKYMIPLGLVYFAEYFINQGLTELITFNNVQMTNKEQYRWYQVCYQIGVLISRSSVNILQINHLWILPVLQLLNAVFLTFEAYFLFVPYFWIIIIIIIYEGLLGGAAYVNTFYKISQEIAPVHREFSMGVTSMADSAGITLAAFIAINAHNLICTTRNV